MTSSTFFRSLAFLLLLSSIHCHEHHNNDADNKWSVFVSHIQSFWKTEPSESQTESFMPTKTPITEKDSSHYYHSHKNTDDNTNHTPRIEIMNGTTTFKDVKEGVKLGLAWLISLPIVGIIVFICCCYCCCKCCASMCSSDDKVVVMNSHVIAPPQQQPQIIVQQPIIQNMHPPREMQQFPPPQNPQWGHHQNFQQPPAYYPAAGGVDNPNFHYPTAPNHMSTDKY